MHQNASNPSNQKESLAKIGLVESQRSEEENPVLKPVSTPDNTFETVKIANRRGSKEVQERAQTKFRKKGLKTIAGSPSSSQDQEKDVMMKDLNNMKKLGKELGQATATATISNDSKAMPLII